MQVEMRYVNLIQDYPMLERWWKARGFPAANPQFIPPTGLILSVDGVDACAGFLFKSDANAAIIGNIVSNPDAPGKARNEALDSLILALTAIAQGQGFGMVCCSTNLEKVMDRFTKNGFVKTDEGVSNFGRVF